MNARAQIVALFFWRALTSLLLVLCCVLEQRRDAVELCMYRCSGGPANAFVCGAWRSERTQFKRSASSSSKGCARAVHAEGARRAARPRQKQQQKHNQKLAPLIYIGLRLHTHTEQGKSQSHRKRERGSRQKTALRCCLEAAGFKKKSALREPRACCASGGERAAGAPRHTAGGARSKKGVRGEEEESLLVYTHTHTTHTHTRSGSRRSSAALGDHPQRPRTPLLREKRRGAEGRKVETRAAAAAAAVRGAKGAGRAIFMGGGRLREARLRRGGARREREAFAGHEQRKQGAPQKPRGKQTEEELEESPVRQQKKGPGGGKREKRWLVKRVFGKQRASRCVRESSPMLRK